MMKESEVDNPMQTPVGNMEIGNGSIAPGDYDVESSDGDDIGDRTSRLSHVDGTPLLRDADMLGCYVNLVNSIIGAGTLGLPFAFAAAGFALGSVLIVWAAGVTTFSLHLLAICSLKVPPPASFFKVAHASIPEFAFLIDVAVASLTFGVGLSYLIVIGGLMPAAAHFMGGSGIFTSRYVWICVGFCIVGPISCLKSLDALKYTSAAAVGCVAFITLLLFSYAVDPSGLSPCDDDGTNCTGPTTDIIFDIDTCKVMGVFFFAFACQMNIFPVVNELKNPTLARLDTCSSGAIFTAMSIYLVVAIAGYSVYGDVVQADVLQNLPETAVVTSARIATCMLVCFSYPVLAVPGRTSMLSLWAMRDPPDFVQSPATMRFRFYATTVFFLFGGLAIALITSELGVVMGLIGATGATIITFILPGAAYYKMHPWGTGPAWKRVAAAALCITGCIIMPFCVTMIFV